MNNSEALVSIIVVTYNSSKTVIETLDSIKNQLYRNIELIISDDCSHDTTVADCQKWLNEHKERFVNTHLVTSSVNTGVSANCNRGFRKAKGEWLKCIAGDDLLFPNCIAEFIDTYKGQAGIVVGRCQKFYVTENGQKCYYDLAPFNKDVVKMNKMSAEQQFRTMLIGNKIVAPAVFIRHRLWNKIGVYDEQFRNMEDYPYWLKCLSKGYRIEFIEIPIAYYRVLNESLSHSKDLQRSRLFYENIYNIKKCYMSYYRGLDKEKLYHIIEEDYVWSIFRCYIILNEKEQGFLFLKTNKKDIHGLRWILACVMKFVYPMRFWISKKWKMQL